jgi:hypothetical protein
VVFENCSNERAGIFLLLYFALGLLQPEDLSKVFQRQDKGISYTLGVLWVDAHKWCVTGGTLD